jgi:hypothetical protein
MISTSKVAFLATCRACESKHKDVTAHVSQLYSQAVVDREERLAVVDWPGPSPVAAPVVSSSLGPTLQWVAQRSHRP